MNSKDKKVILRVTGGILIIGVLLQMFDTDFKYLGQLYAVISATFFGSTIATKWNFIECKLSEVKLYFVFSGGILLISVVWFWCFLESNLVGTIVVVIAGFLASLMYECACQFAKKRNQDKD